MIFAPPGHRSLPMSYRTMYSPAADRFSPLRSAIIFVVLLGSLVVRLGLVADLQTCGRQRTVRRAERQQYQSHVLRARRGDFFDRNGLDMAVTVQTMALFVDPKFMQRVFLEEGRSLV